MHAVAEPRRDAERALPLAPVSVAQLSDLWPSLAPGLAQALEQSQGDENLNDIFIALAREHYQLWSNGKDAAGIAQIVKQPRQTVLTILYAWGALDAVYRCFEFAKTYCQSHGIDVIRVWGRPGWQKALGLEPIGQIMQVRL